MSKDFDEDRSVGRDGVDLDRCCVVEKNGVWFEAGAKRVLERGADLCLGGELH
jgi:hypothetical protein